MKNNTQKLFIITLFTNAPLHMDTNANNRRGRESIRPNAHVQQTAAGNIEFSVNYTNESMRCDRL